MYVQNHIVDLNSNEEPLLYQYNPGAVLNIQWKVKFGI